MEYLYQNGCDIRKNESMANHVRMKVGGKVPYLIIPKTIESFCTALQYCKKNNVSYRILGAGSNLLIADKDHDFIVFSTQYLANIQITGSILMGEAGAPLMRAVLLAAEHGLSGLEFACGIPGSIGGGVYMNAGAYDGELVDYVISVEVFDTHTNTRKILSKDECAFGYRSSCFQQNKNLIILSMQCQLQQKAHNIIYDKIHTLQHARWSKQPLDYPSAGSIFRRPRPDFYVGTAIDALGLKGMNIGGAQVSQKHAGFIVNNGNATYADIQALIVYIQNIIQQHYHESLSVEPEIRD